MKKNMWDIHSFVLDDSYKHNMVDSASIYLLILEHSCLYCRNAVFNDTIYINNVGSSFYTFSLQTLYIWIYREIVECILLCLFICKSTLFEVYECNSSLGLDVGARTPEITASFLCVDDIMVEKV